MAIDTLAYVKALEGAGIDRRAAEAHLKAMTDAIVPGLATKTDLLDTERRLEQRILGAETRLDAKVDRLDAKIDRLEERMRTMFFQASLGILLGTLTVGGLLVRFMR